MSKESVSKVATFLDLEVDTNTTANDVTAMLNSYATTGLAISSYVVIGLIKRTNPNAPLRDEMIKSARLGQASQERRGFPIDAIEYQRVASYLKRI